MLLWYASIVFSAYVSTIPTSMRRIAEKRHGTGLLQGKPRILQTKNMDAPRQLVAENGNTSSTSSCSDSASNHL